MAGFAKKAIRDSFIKLLNERPLSQITVRDIVDACGVTVNNSDYLQKARKYGHFTGYKN